MNQLTGSINNYTLTSQEVAEMVGKNHTDLLRDIRRYITQLGKSKIAFSDFFMESTYESEQHKILPCFSITRKGCEFIGNKLSGQRGTEFTARYVNRFHELEEGSFELSLSNALNSIAKSMNSMKEEIDNRLTKLEESNKSKDNTPLLPSPYKKPYNLWFAKMQPKYKLLEEYFDITRGQLFKNILKEIENIYDIDTQQIQADYCYENNIASCYPLEPYEFNSKYRDMVESIVNSNLIKYGIASENDPITSTRHITIFDTPINEKITK